VQRRVGTAALCIINDSIIREAAIAGVPILDLRAACGQDADFANPIEPSVQGGSKIAAAITSAVIQPGFGLSRCVIFSRGKQRELHRDRIERKSQGRQQPSLLIRLRPPANTAGRSARGTRLRRSVPLRNRDIMRQPSSSVDHRRPWSVGHSFRKRLKTGGKNCVPLFRQMLDIS
jgi:hypothetical protein